MKKHNLFVTLGHLIVFAVLMGASVNAGFVIDQWFKPVFGDAAWLNTLIALGSGVLIGLGCYGLFLHSEHAIRSAIMSKDPDALKYIRVGAIIALNFVFIGIGVAGLLYRLQFVNQQGVQYLILIGVLLEVSTPLFGLAMHPMMHAPVELIEDDLEEEFGRQHVQEVYGAVNRLALPEKQRWYEGEEDAVLDGVIDAEEEKRSRKQPAQQTRRALSRRRGIKGTVKRIWEGDPEPPTPSTYEEEEPNFRSAPLGKQNGRISQ